MQLDKKDSEHLQAHITEELRGLSWVFSFMINALLFILFMLLTYLSLVVVLGISIFKFLSVKQVISS